MKNNWNNLQIYQIAQMQELICPICRIDHKLQIAHIRK